MNFIRKCNQTNPESNYGIAITLQGRSKVENSGGATMYMRRQTRIY